MQVNTRFINSTRGTSSNPPHEADVFRDLNTLCLLTCLVRVTVSFVVLVWVLSFYTPITKSGGYILESLCLSVHLCMCLGFLFFPFCILTLSYCFWISCLSLFFFSFSFLFRDCIICELWYRSHSCYRTHFRCTLCRVRVTVSDSGWLGSKHRLTRPLQSLLLCCDAFGVLIHTLVCWFCRNHC